MIVHTCSYIYGCARQCVCVCVCVIYIYIYMLYGFYSALSVGIQLQMEEVIGTLTMIQATQQLMDRLTRLEQNYDQRTKTNPQTNVYNPSSALDMDIDKHGIEYDISSLLEGTNVCV